MKIEKSGMIDPKLVKINKRFQKYFRIKKSNSDKIYEDMKKNGYDENEPIVLWLETGELCDGYTRRHNVLKLQSVMGGFSHIPYVTKSFKNEDEVIAYMNHKQRSRRNLDLQDNIISVINSDWQNKKIAPNKKKYISELCGISERQAAKYMTILNSPEKLKQVLDTNESDKVKLSELTEPKKQTERKVVKDIKKIAKSIPDDMTVEELEILDKELKAIRKRLREVRG